MKWCLANLYRKGDTVHIVHVVPVENSGPMWYGAFEGPIFLAGENDTVEHGLELVRKTVAPLLQAEDVPHKVHVLQHSTDTAGIAAAVAEKAAALSAHAIILAHHRKSTIGAWLLGSVCGELVKASSEIPLVVVR